MNTQPESRRVPRWLLAIMCAITLGVLGGGYSYYQFRKDGFIAERRQELSAIADLKVSQINNWRNERIGDGNSILDNPLVFHHIRMLFHAEAPPQVRRDILTWLRLMNGAYKYRTSMICSPDGDVMISTDPADSPGMAAREGITAVTAGNCVMLSDLIRRSDSSDIHMNLLVPFKDPGDPSGKVFAVLIFRIDPRIILYPLLETWPAQSRTAETYIVRQERDSVLYLSELRHRPHSALQYRLPMSDAGLAASAAIRSGDGSIDGIDYRHVRVVAAARKVSDSGWYIVAKVDEEELLAPLRRELALMIAFAALLVIVSIVSAGFVWRSRRAEYYRRQYYAETARERAERELLKSEETFHSVVDSSPVGMLFFQLDADGNLRFAAANEAAARTLRRPLAVRFGSTIEEVFPKLASTEIPDVFKRTARGELGPGHLQLEYRDELIDGYYDVSVFNTNPGSIAVYIEDVTEQTAAKEQLALSEELFSKAFSTSPLPMSLINTETSAWINVNDAWSASYGYRQEEVVGRTHKEIPLFVNPVEWDSALFLLKKTGKVERFQTMVQTRTGEIRSGVFSAEIFTAGLHRYILTVFDDMTERRATEERLMKTQRQYQLLAENVDDVIWILDAATMRFTYVSPSVERLRGFTPAEVLEQSIDEVLTPASLSLIRGTLEQAVRRIEVGDDPGSSQLEIEQCCKDGSTVATEIVTTAVRTESGGISIVGVTRNIAERKKAEKNILRLNRLYSFISEVNKLIVHTGDRDTLLEEVCRITIDYGKFRMAWIGMIDEAKQAVIPVAWSGHEDGYLDRVNGITLRDVPGGRGPTGSTVRELRGMTGPTGMSVLEGRYFYSNDIAHDPRMAPWREKALQRGYAASIAIPLIIKGKPVGAFSIYSTEPLFFNDEEVELLSHVTGDISYALEMLENESIRKQKETELRLKDIVFETSVAGNIIADTKGLISQVNTAALRMWGFSEPREVIGKSIRGFIALPAVADEIAASIETRGQWTGEYEAVRKDGSSFAAFVTATILRDLEGKFTGFQSSILDISERKRMEETLREREKQYRELFESSIDAIYKSTHAGRFIDVNSAMVSMLGYGSREELLAVDIPTALYFAAGDRDVPSSAITAGESAIYPLKRKDGTVVWVEDHGRYITDEQGAILYHEGILRDITSRIASEQALREQQDIYSAIVDQANESIALVDPETGAFHSFNDTACGSLGYTRGEFARLTLADIKFGMGPEEIVQFLQQQRKEGTAQFESRHRHRDGTVLDRLVSTRIVNIRGKEYLASIWSDVTERKKAETQLRRLTQAIEQLASSVIITDKRGVIGYVNDAAVRASGYAREELIGAKPSLLKSGETPPGVYADLWNTIASGREWRGEFHNRKRDGRLYWERAVIAPVKDDSGAIINYIAVKDDITEWKEMQSQLLRSQRLESIGTLAGGIAHDLNNILGPILLSVQVLRMKVQDETLQKLISTIESSTKRGKDIVAQVLSFARGTEGKPVLVQLRHIVGEVENVIKQTFSKKIEIQTYAPRDLWTVNADPTQIHQVLVNLCVNARDAMPDGGRLSVTVANATVDESLASRNPDARPGQYLEIEVRDTGSGIPPDLQQKIFDPFFTTKEPGKGTGLGLSTVYRIIRQHNGFIRLHSVVGQGTSFTVYLPAAAVPGSAAPEMPGAAVVRGNKETVLVVEDEPAIQTVCRETLEYYNYTVLVAQNGADAITKYLQNGAAIKLVLMDMMMPVMDGPTAAAALRKIEPTVKIIGMSGLMSDTEGVNLSDLFNHFLRKPFTGRELMEAVGRLLAGT